MVPSDNDASRALVYLLQRARGISQIFRVHARLIAGGLAGETFLAGRLLLAVAELGTVSPEEAPAYAELVFSGAGEPNTFLWNTLIRIHAAGADPRRGVAVFRRMRRRGAAADQYTFPFVLKSCGLSSSWEEGREIHGEIIKRGWESHLFVTNALIALCCRCGELCHARKLFDGMPRRDLVSWNSMISGYAGGGGKMMEAQELFDEMPDRDGFSWAIMIDGYGKKAGELESARKLFDEMPERGDLVCWNSMIAGYVAVGRMEEARRLFDSMADQNVISWSTIIEGYVNHGDPKEALSLFQRMLLRGVKADRVSAVGAISACAQLGALELGRWIHFYLRKNRIHLDVVIHTALVDMYMKCGSVKNARSVFDRMPNRNVISWNAMIVGLGTNGRGEEALDLFHQMEEDGIAADELTFLGALTACAHTGRVDEGLAIFRRMRSRSQIGVEHCGCVVDLLARAGRLREARELIEKMTVAMAMEPAAVLWGSLMAACRVHGEADLAEECGRRLVEIDGGGGGEEAGALVLLSNVYAEAGRWEEVWEAREGMRRRG
ncbi:unnamed protein product [Spirodela intermedia]|nr:unnamed protein product [Spirodela intermedia]CAA6668762.1 unnamed protein product [Spirodela intermedia]